MYRFWMGLTAKHLVLRPWKSLLGLLGAKNRFSPTLPLYPFQPKAVLGKSLNRQAAKTPVPSAGGHVPVF